jgi:hypothetical protein
LRYPANSEISLASDRAATDIPPEPSPGLNLAHTIGRRPDPEKSGISTGLTKGRDWPSLMLAAKLGVESDAPSTL